MQGPARTLFLGCVLPALAAAAYLAPAVTRAAGPAPLFASSERLELALTVPLRQLVLRARSRPEVAGTVSYTGPDGSPVALAVEVSTRGRSRLEYCRFPPLRLKFKRKEIEDTLFAEQKRIKLVTQCRNGRNFEQYVTLERLLYGVYEQVSDFALRARAVQMRYVDSERDDFEEAPAFFIERAKGVAERLDMTAVKVPRLAVTDIRPDALAVLSLFQFMIGNTDWSALAPSSGDHRCCHNGIVLAPPDGGEEFVVVPYDFDQAGLIGAVYALPAESLGIRSVRQRAYRGFCASNDYLDEAISSFNAARPAIEALFDDPAVEERTRADALEYLRDSFAIVNDPEKRQRQIVERCRGG